VFKSGLPEDWAIYRKNSNKDMTMVLFAKQQYYLNLPYTCVDFLEKLVFSPEAQIPTFNVSCIPSFLSIAQKTTTLSI